MPRTITIVSDKDLVDITPDVRLLRVLRNSGFNNMTALGELLDNSVDAGANHIDIYVQEMENGKIMLSIVDNGKGMSDNTLQYALTLAKELKVGIDQLGKFGMGMKTAALSMTTQMEIFTKTSHNDICFGEFNMNKIEQLGSFKTKVRPATDEERTFYNSKTKGYRSGTIIILKNCDRIGVKADTFLKQIVEYIGKTYRVFINRGCQFTISDNYKKGKTIEAIDPLMRDHKDTILVRDRETYPIDYRLTNGNTKTSFIEVSAVVLPKAEKQGKLVDGKPVPLTINAANQGLYFLREGREVASAVTWNTVFGERHPSMNRIRIEVVVKSELDDEIKMDFQKGNVFPTARFKQQLGEIIKDDILKELKQILEKQEKEEKEKKEKVKRKGTFKVPTPSQTTQNEESETYKEESNEEPTHSTLENETKDVTEKPSIHLFEKDVTGNITEDESKTPVYLDEDKQEKEKGVDVSYVDIFSAAQKVKMALISPETPNVVKEQIFEILGLKI